MASDGSAAPASTTEFDHMIKVGGECSDLDGPPSMATHVLVFRLVHTCLNYACLQMVVVGDAFVGKSALLVQYTENKFDPHVGPTISVDVKVCGLIFFHSLLQAMC
jgi:hypothetical protein